MAQSVGNSDERIAGYRMMFEKGSNVTNWKSRKSPDILCTESHEIKYGGFLCTKPQIYSTQRPICALAAICRSMLWQCAHPGRRRASPAAELLGQPLFSTLPPPPRPSTSEKVQDTLGSLSLGRDPFPGAVPAGLRRPRATPELPELPVASSSHPGRAWVIPASARHRRSPSVAPPSGDLRRAPARHRRRSRRRRPPLSLPAAAQTLNGPRPGPLDHRASPPPEAWCADLPQPPATCRRRPNLPPAAAMVAATFGARGEPVRARFGPASPPPSSAAVQREHRLCLDGRTRPPPAPPPPKLPVGRTRHVPSSGLGD
ncbi:basic proline-rich protein-like [Ananas comosus]|uniref:Basic proline-rich protein-like n=1 Tax=Ananas comosus TaxID=4615 RepID=A0A6P5GS12_ANACO|nr:basic proline-rich protein-like [Ananas comosus]